MVLTLTQNSAHSVKEWKFHFIDSNYIYGYIKNASGTVENYGNKAINKLTCLQRVSHLAYRHYQPLRKALIRKSSVSEEDDMRGPLLIFFIFEKETQSETKGGAQRGVTESEVGSRL